MNTLSNQVQLIGNLGKDPELITFDSGNSVCKFSLATNETYKDREGNKVQNTDWHNILVWGKRGEFLADVLKKGSSVAIAGKITSRSYDDKSGNKRYITEIITNDFLLLDKKEDKNEKAA